MKYCNQPYDLKFDRKYMMIARHSEHLFLDTYDMYLNKEAVWELSQKINLLYNNEWDNEPWAPDYVK